MAHRLRIAVIGGTASGTAAAAEAKRANPEAEVVLFEQNTYVAFGACEIPYFVGGWLQSPDQLIALTPEEFERTRKVKVRVLHRVEALYPRERRLVYRHLAYNSVHERTFDRFILAVGARPRRLQLPGEEAPNVFYVRLLEDAVGMREYLESEPVRHVVVVGGGYIGVEMAEVLRLRGLQVTLLEPTGKLLNTMIEDELRPLVHRKLEAEGIILRQEGVVGFEQNAAGLVQAVVTDRKEKIGCQMVVVAIGVQPNVELAIQAGIQLGKTGAIAVDDQMHTSSPNVWACGDCIEVKRVVDRTPIYLPLSPNAFRTARVAARNATRMGRGRPAVFPGVTPASAVKIFGLEIAAVGLSLQQAKERGFDAVSVTIKHWSQAPVMPGARPVYVRLIVERGTARLLGGEVLGEDGAALRADILIPFVRQGLRADDLEETDLIYTPPVAPARDPLWIAASAARKVALTPVEKRIRLHTTKTSRE